MNNEKYSDIINLPHPDPRTRPRMSLSDRAAQFAPFAALTGYDDAITEEGRLTSSKIELDENELHEAVSGHSPALILGIVLIYNRFHAIAEKADIHFHRSLKWDVQFEEFLIFLLRFKVKMYPVILENMTFHTSVVLGSAFRIEKDGICGNLDIFSVNGKNRIGFQQKKEIITASIGAVNVKICIMAVIIACVVDNQIASSLKNKQTAPRQSAERHYSFIFSGS